jgi:hypothetical protein
MHVPARAIVRRTQDTAAHGMFATAWSESIRDSWAAVMQRVVWCKMCEASILIKAA